MFTFSYPKFSTFVRLFEFFSAYFRISNFFALNNERKIKINERIHTNTILHVLHAFQQWSLNRNFNFCARSNLPNKWTTIQKIFFTKQITNTSWTLHNIERSIIEILPFFYFFSFKLLSFSKCSFLFVWNDRW